MKPFTTIFKYLLPIVILLVGATIFASFSRFQFAQPSSNIQAQSKEEGKIPVVPFEAEEPRDSVERALRFRKGRQYDKSARAPFNELRSDTTEVFVVNHWWEDLPALPTANSDAVILGKIVDAKAYLSNDKTGAYTELVINIENTFKFDGRIKTNSIIAERRGANVQLPDHRIIKYGVEGQNLPEIGKRYVLFLKYNFEGDSFDILTGYEIRQGKSHPLDQGPANRFSQYEGEEEAKFLKEVREAVEFPPRLTEEKRRWKQ
jgi:hypothetical protein